MDHNIALLAEAAQVLGEASPRRAFGGGATGVVTGPSSSTAAGASHLPSPSSIMMSSAPSPASALQHQQQYSPSAVSSTTASSMVSHPSLHHHDRKNRNNVTPQDSLGIAMLQDVSATKDIVDLAAFVHDRELTQLQQAAALLEEEKRIRTEYIASLHSQMDSLAMQRKKLLAPYTMMTLDGAGAAGDDNATAAAIAAAIAAAASSSAAGGTNSNEQRRVAMMMAMLQQQQQQQQAASGRGSSSASASSAIMQGNRSVVALQQQQQQSVAGSGSEKAASIGIGGGAPSVSARDSIAPSGSSMQRLNHGNKKSSSSNGRSTALDIPGVCFGPLTTASCASRYAKHWSQEAQNA